MNLHGSLQALYWVHRMLWYLYCSRMYIMRGKGADHKDPHMQRAHHFTPLLTDTPDL